MVVPVLVLKRKCLEKTKRKINWDALVWDTTHKCHTVSCPRGSIVLINIIVLNTRAEVVLR